MSPAAPDSSSVRPPLGAAAWVLALAALLCAAVVAWALLGVVLGSGPIGDGRDPHSYGFDLGRTELDGAALVASGEPRDFLPALDQPAVAPGTEVPEINRRERGKFLVSADRVVGVEIDGVARAYPLSVLNAHEVCNDTLAGVPIAVTYSPLCDSVVVFDRRLALPDGTTREARFGVSGLLLDSNLLLYDRAEAIAADDGGDGNATVGPRSLFSQLAMKAVAGPAMGTVLEPIPDVQLVAWADWLAQHPGTTVALRDPASARRYKEFDYRRYWLGGEPLFPVARRGDGLAGEAMDPVVVLERNGERLVLSHAQVREAAAAGSPLERQLGGATVSLRPGGAPDTVIVEAPADTLILHLRRFAWESFGLPGAPRA